MAHFGANRSADNFQDFFLDDILGFVFTSTVDVSKNRWGNFAQVFQTPKKFTSSPSRFRLLKILKQKRLAVFVEEIILKVGLPKQLLTRGPEGTYDRIRAFFLMCLLHWKKISCIGESPVVATWSESSIHLLILPLDFST